MKLCKLITFNNTNRKQSKDFNFLHYLMTSLSNNRPISRFHFFRILTAIIQKLYYLWKPNFATKLSLLKTTFV